MCIKTNPKLISDCLEQKCNLVNYKKYTMLSSIKKDKNRRALVKKFEIKRLQLKVLLQDLSLKKALLSCEAKKRGIDSLKVMPHTKGLTEGFSKSETKLTKNNALATYSFISEKASKRIPRNSSKNRVENRCIETGRSRAVLRFCKLSRICLRDKASKGAIPGISKASW